MLRTRTVVSLALVAAAAMSLSACAGTKRALGMQKTAPDEFAVVSHGPLAMPPDFDLRPPVPGAERPQDIPPSEQARSALMGRQKIEAMRASGMSRGETDLLVKAGAENTPPDVRETLDKEASVFAGEQHSFTDRLLFWRDTKTASKDDDLTLAPEAEEHRLQENQAEGKKPNAGSTPVISKGGGGFLGVF
jgi:hypothetical protein